MISIITLIFLISDYSYGQASKDIWREIIKDHKLDRNDFRVIDQKIILSDSISETGDRIYFNNPAYISKGKDNYYIYNCDSVVFSKNDSVLTLYNGFSVGFSETDNESKPVLISEFDRIISEIKSGQLIAVAFHKCFYWRDESYFSNKNYNISTGVKTDN
ncbi:MAG: hypothetical protein A2V66_17945 [Ignavibacteria bacterium RBG_13_36_8]|nr:MAG: hypothetical protein A2V66_17945 [Ignavibacteria bacterium RBG_13_36_8]